MSPTRYSNTAIALHWAIAILLTFQLGLGWHMMGLPQGSAMYSAFQFHKSVGMLILVLSLARVGVRLSKPRPPEVRAGRAARLLAGSVHFILYAVMIAGPLTGWIVVSTARIAIPTVLFGIVPLPHLPMGQAWHGLAELGHELLALIGAGLIILHLAGAMRHHLLLRGTPGEEHEDVIGRMIPLAGRRAGNGWKMAGATGAAALLLAGFGLPWLVFAPPVALEATSIAAPATPAIVVDVVPAASPLASASAEPEPAESQQADAADKAVPPSKWRVENGGRLGFTATMNGAAINGRFGQWTADILFDPEALAESSIVVRVPLLSADTGDASRDEMLKGPNFFGSAGGNAVFRSTAIRKLSGTRFAASGNLSMNGKSRPATLNFDLSITGDRARVTGTSQLDRVAFGIGSGEWASTDQIAAGVGVNFAFDARRVE